MSGRSSYFYADENDLASLLEAFRILDGFKYVQMRSELNKPTEVYNDPVHVLPYALVSPEKPYRTHSFLVSEASEEISIEDNILKNGNGVRKWVGQSMNPNSITLAFGGHAGNQTILMSDVATIGETKKAIEIHKKFKKVVLANTIRIGGKGRPYRLMAGAVEKLKSGWHLTQNRVWSPGVEEIQLSEEELVKLG